VTVLDEIPLARLRQADPGNVARRVRVHQMAELVKEGDNLAVIQQHPAGVRCRISEIADHHHMRQLLSGDASCSWHPETWTPLFWVNSGALSITTLEPEPAVDAGAVQRAARDATAWNTFDARWSMVIAAIDSDQARTEALRAWRRAYLRATYPFNMEGAYVNLMMDDEVLSHARRR